MSKDNELRGSPSDLVQDILRHSAHRIRFNTATDSGELTMKTGGSIHCGTYQDRLAFTETPSVLQEHYARIDHNGYQAIIKATRENPITLQYQNQPRRDKPRTHRLKPDCAMPLYTQKQLQEATKHHDVANLARGVTRAFLTEHQTDQPGVKALGTEIGFSNQALYKALRVTNPQPLRTRSSDDTIPSPNTGNRTYNVKPDKPETTTRNIDIPTR